MDQRWSIYKASSPLPFSLSIIIPPHFIRFFLVRCFLEILPLIVLKSRYDSIESMGNRMYGSCMQEF